ncbi:MAG: tetratricopeptide repeat protein [Steroidobacteraceae bacterium]
MNPNRIGALVALIEQRRLGEAEEQARALLKTHPAEGMLWKILSVSLVRQGKDALPALRRTAELLPQDAESHANLGAALHDLGRWEEALVSLQRALEIRPRDAQALVDAADALRGLGRARESVALYQRALEIEPRSPEGQNNLGNALLQLGQPADAVACYRLALEIKPDDAPVHCNLGLALAGLGQRAQAVSSYRQALLLDPGYVEALNNLGNVLRDLGERSEAMLLYRRAIELAPQRTDSHLNLGNALYELRQMEAAADCFRRTLALQPDLSLAHSGLAAALRMQRRTAEAEASCRAALASDPKNVEALTLLGELRADRGQFAQAQELFLRALAIDPDWPSVFCSIAAHRKMTSADGTWLAGAQALLAKPLPLGQAVNLRYTLGKYFDDVGQYDDAFSHYRQANELSRRSAAAYDREKLTQRVDRVISTFDAGSVRRSRSGASATELPVFIIGMPRSGTSLTEQILASHSEVFGAGELRFWDGAFTTLERAGPGDEAGAALIADLARDYLQRVAALGEGRARVVDKMPANFLYAGLIHAALPRARIIHMQRHPLDTCVSIYFQNFFNVSPYANDLDDLAHYYREYVRVTDHWRAVLPASTLLEVPYEALLEDQEGWSRRMLDFIGLPWDPRCLEFQQTERVVLTASRWQVRQRITTASVGRWRNYEKYVAPLLALLDSGARH